MNKILFIITGLPVSIIKKRRQQLVSRHATLHLLFAQIYTAQILN